MLGRLPPETKSPGNELLAAESAVAPPAVLMVEGPPPLIVIETLAGSARDRPERVAPESAAALAAIACADGSGSVDSSNGGGFLPLDVELRLDADSCG